MKLTYQTKGHYDFVNITDDVAAAVAESGVIDGVVTVFIKGSTATITCLEWGANVDRDIINLWEKLAPEHADYEHHKTWGDRNGAAHIKAAFMKPDLSIPIEHGKMVVGAWQQIVLIDFDEKPREREVYIKIVKSTRH